METKLMDKHLSLKKNEEKAIKILKKELSKKYNLVNFTLFGSKVNGTSNSDSDIDVMIEIADSTPDTELQIYDIIFEVNLKHDSFISATIFNKNEIEEGPLSESPIYKKIMKEGISI